MKKVAFLLAGKVIISTLSLIMIFHLLVLFGIIPYDIVWGGRLENHNQMVQMEVVSISINLIAILATMIKVKLLSLKISHVVINIVLWIFAILFAINTIGNLFSLNSLETIIFTPITFVLAFLMLRLVLEKEH